MRGGVFILLAPACSSPSQNTQGSANWKIIKLDCTNRALPAMSNLECDDVCLAFLHTRMAKR